MRTRRWRLRPHGASARMRATRSTRRKATMSTTSTRPARRRAWTDVHTGNGEMRGKGFTLIELLVVMAIVSALLTIVTPRYMRQADRAKEAALRENLGAMRIAL